MVDWTPQVDDAGSKTMSVSMSELGLEGKCCAVWDASGWAFTFVASLRLACSLAATTIAVLEYCTVVL